MASCGVLVVDSLEFHWAFCLIQKEKQNIGDKKKKKAKKKM
jgi:hypothetical protein